MERRDNFSTFPPVFPCVEIILAIMTSSKKYSILKCSVQGDKRHTKLHCTNTSV